MAAITKSEGRTTRTAHDEGVRTRASSYAELISGRADLLARQVSADDVEGMRRSLDKLYRMLQPDSDYVQTFARYYNVVKG